MPPIRRQRAPEYVGGHEKKPIRGQRAPNVAMPPIRAPNMRAGVRRSGSFPGLFEVLIMPARKVKRRKIKAHHLDSESSSLRFKENSSSGQMPLSVGTVLDYCKGFELRVLLLTATPPNSSIPSPVHVLAFHVE